MAALASVKPPVTPVVEPVIPVVESPVPTTVHETILSMDLIEYDIEGPTVHENVPPPPKIVQRKLERLERTWRWLTKGHVDKKGMRQYTAYSPDTEDKLAMERGDSPPGVHVSVDNRLCWGEDAFLGTIPRRFFEARQRELAKLNQRTLVESRRPDALDELARRGGFKKVRVDVDAQDDPRRRI